MGLIKASNINRKFIAFRADIYTLLKYRIMSLIDHGNSYYVGERNVYL